MTDAIRDRAIEAAAKAWFHEMYGDGYDDPENWTARAVARDFVTPLVDAVLAVAGPAYRAEALRDAARDYNYKAGVLPERWLTDRADAEETP